MPTEGQGWRGWPGSLSHLWCRLACLILKLLVLYGGTSSLVSRQHHTATWLQGHGESGQRGDGLLGPKPFSRSSLALADGYHLGLPLFSCKLAIEVSVWTSHLLNVCSSDTNSWCSASQAEHSLGQGWLSGHPSATPAWRPLRSYPLVKIWNLLEPSSLPSGSSQGSELMFSLQLKISYFEAHRCSFCSLWLCPLCYKWNITYIHINTTKFIQCLPGQYKPFLFQVPEILPATHKMPLHPMGSGR